MRTRAAPQACSWRAGSACSDAVKMNRGSELSASVGFALTSLPTSEEVKRSGAVSPATRAVASVAPVTIPPTAIGRTTLRVVRHFARADGEARLAQRVRAPAGDDLRRACDQRQHEDRQRERRLERALAVSEHDEDVDEDADHDRGHAVQHVEREGQDDATRAEARARSGRSRRGCRPAAPSGRRRRRSRAIPTSAFATPLSPPNPRNDGVLVKKSTSMRRARASPPTRRR